MMITSAQRERHGPLVLAVGAAAAWWAFDRSLGASIPRELVTALLTASAIAAGFLTTALSILPGSVESRVMRQLRRSQYEADVHDYLRAGIRACLWLAALCVTALFYENALPRWIAAALVFQAVFAGAAVLRIAEALLSIVRRASNGFEPGVRFLDHLLIAPPEHQRAELLQIPRRGEVPSRITQRQVLDSFGFADAFEEPNPRRGEEIGGQVGHLDGLDVAGQVQQIGQVLLRVGAHLHHRCTRR